MTDNLFYYLIYDEQNISNKTLQTLQIVLTEKLYDMSIDCWMSL